MIGGCETAVGPSSSGWIRKRADFCATFLLLRIRHLMALVPDLVVDVWMLVENAGHRLRLALVHPLVHTLCHCMLHIASALLPHCLHTTRSISSRRLA